MPRITLPEKSFFSLDLTLGCGQVFRWEKTGEWWTGVLERDVIRIRQKGRTLIFEGSSKERIRDYLGLDTNLCLILDTIDLDPTIHNAITSCAGLRLVNQPPWECLASYICATYTNIPGVRRKVALLSETFGEPIYNDSGSVFYSFPSAEILADAAPCNLSRCRLGYREPYLCATAREIAADHEWIDRIHALEYTLARRELMRLMGVGPKVADCVLLFSFKKYEAFPVDVWIARIMQRYYGALGKGDYRNISRIGKEYFGKYAGYAQEYLYCDRKRLLS